MADPKVAISLLKQGLAKNKYHQIFEQYVDRENGCCANGMMILEMGYVVGSNALEWIWKLRDMIGWDLVTTISDWNDLDKYSFEKIVEELEKM